MNRSLYVFLLKTSIQLMTVSVMTIAVVVVTEVIVIVRVALILVDVVWWMASGMNPMTRLSLCTTHFDEMIRDRVRMNETGSTIQVCFGIYDNHPGGQYTVGIWTSNGMRPILLLMLFHKIIGIKYGQ